MRKLMVRVRGENKYWRKQDKRLMMTARDESLIMMLSDEREIFGDG